MKSCPLLFPAILSGLVCLGCGGNVSELTAKVAALEARTAELESEKVRLETELAAAQQRLDRFAAIERGYEAARVKLQAGLSQMAPLLGLSGSPLPPFDALQDSDWVGKLVPDSEATAGLKELKDQLKGLFGNEGDKKPTP